MFINHNEMYKDFICNLNVVCPKYVDPKICVKFTY